MPSNESPFLKYHNCHIGVSRGPRLSYQTYQYIEKYAHSSGGDENGLYCYNFCLNTNVFDTHPSGAVDMSKFQKIEVEFTTILPPLDDKNQITQISFNNYDRAPFRLNPELTKIFYEAISLFDNLANSKQYQWRHILKPGELLIFNNWRVLHGRGSFNGKRKIKGCYINKEDFDSSCKINGLI